ncbi:MAG: hypothetical protein NC238_09155 [Dehalobacter sp.]|nr:hypothetical protein [Dehalobacter sp.]
MEKNDYFRFSRKSSSWNGDTLRAEPLDYSDTHSKIQREWWYGKPLSIPFPELRFSYPEDAPLIDNLWNATLFEIYSPRLISILQNLGIAHELYPVHIIGEKTGRIIPIEYRVFRLLEIHDVLDKKASRFRYENHRGQTIEYLEEPVYKEKFRKLKMPLTRIKGFENIAIVHKDLKALLEKEGISGCSFSTFPVRFPYQQN